MSFFDPFIYLLDIVKVNFSVIILNFGFRIPAFRVARHLHQRVEEHKNSSSSIGKHFRHKYSFILSFI